MKLEQQVVSLDLSKRLKELGVKQESIWYWVLTDEGKCELALNSRGYQMYSHSYIRIPDYGNIGDGLYGWRENKEDFSAFTVAELGEMLPHDIIQERPPKGFLIGYSNQDTYHIEKSETEADARAKMLIYLIENNLITI